MSKRTKKKRARRSRWGIVPPIVAVLLVTGLAGAMAIQPTRQLLAQRERISDMHADLRDAVRSNRAMERRIARLNDPDYLEQEAREAGLARPGETVYNVVPPSRKHQRRVKLRKEERTRRVRPQPGFMDRFLNFVGLD